MRISAPSSTRAWWCCAPGSSCLGSRAAWGEALTLSLPTKTALGGLLALGTWAALSALWSPAPDVAIADAQRILGYAVAFGLGIWIRILLRERSELAMAPLALAGLVAGGYTVGVLLTGDDFLRYVDRGTLQLPLGYRNANAAFFIVAMVPGVMLASSRQLDWRIRALALARQRCAWNWRCSARAEDRFSRPVARLVVLMFASRERARTFGWLVLTVVPAIVVIPAISDLFATGDIEGYTVRPSSERRDGPPSSDL